MKKYDVLVEKVALIDKHAAEYLTTEAKNLDSFVAANNIAGAFIWSDTPQGREYWRSIKEKVEELENYFFL